MFKFAVYAFLAAATTAAASAQTVKATIPTALPTVGLAANPATNKIYVAAPSFGGATDTILVLNGSTDKVIKQISVPLGAANLPVVDYLRNIVYTVGCDTYSANFACILTAINGKTDTVITTKTIFTTPGDGILGVAFNPILNKIYIANGSENLIDVVDARTYKVECTISTSDREPFGISFNPLNQRLYIPFFTDQIEVFDVIHKTRLADVTFGTADANTAVNYLTGNVYVTDDILGTASVGVLDKSGNSVADVPVQDSPYGVDVDPVTNKVFAVSTGTATLNVIDGKTNTLTAALSGISANYVAVNFGTQKVYLSGDSGITVVSEK